MLRPAGRLFGDSCYASKSQKLSLKICWVPEVECQSIKYLPDLDANAGSSEHSSRLATAQYRAAREMCVPFFVSKMLSKNRGLRPS